GFGPKNNARALASPNMLPTSQAVVMPVNAFDPELTGVKWFAPWRNTIATGPLLWLKSSLPLRVEFASPHGARLSAVPHRISDGLPERSWPLAVAVKVLSGSIGMVQSTRASRAAFTVPLPPCEWPAVQTKSPPPTGLPCATVMPCTICEPVPVLPDVLAATMIPYDAHWFSRPLYELGEPPVPLPHVRIGEPAGRPMGRNSVKPETLMVCTWNWPGCAKRLSVSAPLPEASEAIARRPSTTPKIVDRIMKFPPLVESRAAGQTRCSPDRTALPAELPSGPGPLLWASHFPYGRSRRTPYAGVRGGCQET